MSLTLPSDTRCVLVGNGPSVLRCDGAKIDAHDEIVRFNRFRLQGFEAHTGTRTTLWSTFGHGYLPGDEKERPKRILFVYGDRGNPAYDPDEIYRIPMSFYWSVKDRVLTYSKRKDEALKKTGMTSGMVVAAYLLEVVGLHCLSLAGFDHFMKTHSNQHHYYNPKGYGRPPELDGDAEAAIFAKWCDEGKVVYL